MTATPTAPSDGADRDTRAVFIVHGRNDSVRRSMFEFLRSVDLRPIEWSKAIELTGVASPYIGQVLDAAFAHAQAVVVLMTPDEIAYLQPRYALAPDEADTLPAPQARPNVLFEAGMAMGRDPDRTVLVEVGAVRPFSDIAGRHVIRLSGELSSRQGLASRLRIAGCPVDLTGTDWHTTGDFSPPLPPGDGLPLGRRLPQNSEALPAVRFDATYHQRTNVAGRLQIINRGTESAYEVRISVPNDAALDLHGRDEIEKIPGGGKSVTVPVLDRGGYFGGGAVRSAFDLTISARTDSGEDVEQQVFLDMEG